ncbi:MAG: metal ABC transporter solute-binding protein, Zn/Mn family [Nanobdellota archaeon]
MRKKSFILVFIIVSIFAIFLSGCSDPEEQDKPLALVSILPQEEFVEAVAGDEVEVHSIIPPGSSPTTYNPKPSDMVKVEEADVFFRIGHVPFEKANIEKLRSVNEKMRIVDTSEGIPLREKDGNVDPHIWLSPKLVKEQVNTIYETLAEMHPEKREFYKRNKEDYIDRLDELHENISSSLDGGKLLVFHPSWGYFADEYGLEQIAIEKEGNEPTVKGLKNIIDEAEEKDIKAVFVQEQFNEDIAKSVAEETGAKIISVDPLARDYVENLRKVTEKMEQNIN